MDAEQRSEHSRRLQLSSIWANIFCHVSKNRCVCVCACAHTAAQQSPILAGQEGGSTGLESARCMRVKGVI